MQRAFTLQLEGGDHFHFVRQNLCPIMCGVDRKQVIRETNSKDSARVDREDYAYVFSCLLVFPGPILVDSIPEKAAVISVSVRNTPWNNPPVLIKGR